LKSWSLNLLEPSGLVQACNGSALHLHFVAFDGYLLLSSQYNILRDALFRNGSNLCRKTQYFEVRRGFTQRPQANVD
jgi:hypothetical protein